MEPNQFHQALDAEENCKYVSAEELQIIWGDNPLYWEMVPDQNSMMFPKTIARLKNVCWFDVKGEIVCSLPSGDYTISWRIHLLADSCGWDSEPAIFTFSKNETEFISECKCYIGRTRSDVSRVQTIRAVENGWTEYDVGEFVVEDGEENCALKFAMVATGGIWKCGLSLDGVVIRPKSLTLSSAPVELGSNTEVSGAGPSNSMIAAKTSEHSRRIMTNEVSGKSSLGSESRGQIGASFQAVKENMDAHSGLKQLDPDTCEICHLERIVKLLSSHASDGIFSIQRRIGLHKLQANAEHCNYCRFLVQTCESDPSLFQLVDSVGGEVTIMTIRDKGFARLELEGTFKDGIKNMDIQRRFKSRILQVTGSSDSQDDSTHFSGRIVPDKTDFGLCRTWLVNCSKYHSRRCCSEIMDPTELGLRLINIKTRSIGLAPQDAKYAALSYVWGGAMDLVLNDDTFQRLTGAEGLSDEHTDIPQTICDAMTVASLLGFNYLWVDALCIKQDDEADKLRQIAKMDKVYSCAALTIVSTGPNAKSEIPGLRGNGRQIRPGVRNQAVCEVGDIRLVNTLPTLSQALSASTWDRRGWTLQEKALSKRLLIFTKFQVYWHCNSAVYAEDTILELSNDTRNLTQIVESYEEYSAELRRIYKPSPKKSAEYQYTSLLRSYMTRELSYPSDALNAFKGVLNIFEPKLGSHHWGLPTLIFDWAMLWEFDCHFPESRRKNFPSWSWAGWKGGADVHMNESGTQPVSKILWWRIDGTGTLVSINPEDKAIQSGYTNEFFGVDSTSPPPRPDDIPSEYSNDWAGSPDRSHVLRFWTSVAPVCIGRRGRARSKNCSAYPVYVPGREAHVSRVILDNAWRESHGDHFDVIFLSRVGGNAAVTLSTMLIEWDHDTAYRVQQFLFPLRLAHWESAKPQFKLITLA